MPRRGPHAYFVLLYLGALLPATSALADRNSLEVSVEPSTIHKGENVLLTIEAQLQGSANADIALPDLSTFQVLSEEHSTPFQASFGFGQKPIVRATRVHRLLLRAGQSGVFTLEVGLKGSGQTLRRKVTLRVLEDLNAPQNQPAPTLGPELNVSEIPKSAVDSQAFVYAAAYPSNPYVGQQVTVTYYLFLRQALSADPVVAREPTFNDFWVQDLLSIAPPHESQEHMIHGLSYRAYILRNIAAFPLKTGELEITPLAVKLPLGSSWFGPDRHLARNTRALRIRVKAQPGNRNDQPPAVVGQLTLKAELEPKKVQAGDAATLTLTVAGTGNLGQVRPQIKVPQGIRLFKPTFEDEFTLTHGLLGGQREIRWTVMADKPGKYQIGNVVLATLDPEQDTYHWPKAAPVTLDVAQGAASTQPAPKPTHTQTLSLSKQPIAGAHALIWDAPLTRWSIAIAAALLVLFSWLGLHRPPKKKETQLQRDHHQELYQRLEALASTGLRETESYFFAETAKLIRDAIAAVIHVKTQGLSQRELLEHLEQKGLPSAHTRALLEACDRSRFAPQTHPVSRTEIVERLKAAFSEFFNAERQTSR